MAAKAETEQRVGLENVSRQENGSFTHEDLTTLLGSNYRELFFGPLNWLNIADDISQLHFKDRTERHIKPNGHKSDAHYFLEQKINNHRIYGYVLIPEPQESGELIGRTSEHMHSFEGRKVVEHYLVIIGGSMDLVMDNENEESARVVTLSSTAPHVMVPPETYHQAEISRGVVAVLVIMPETADIPDSELHIPRQKKAA